MSSTVACLWVRDSAAAIAAKAACRSSNPLAPSSKSWRCPQTALATDRTRGRLRRRLLRLGRQRDPQVRPGRQPAERAGGRRRNRLLVSRRRLRQPLSAESEKGSATPRARYRRVRPGRQHRAPLRLRRDQHPGQRPRPLPKRHGRSLQRRGSTVSFTAPSHRRARSSFPAPAKPASSATPKPRCWPESTPRAKRPSPTSNTSIRRASKTKAASPARKPKPPPRATRSAPTSSSTTPRPRPNWCPKPPTTAG